MVHDVPSTTQLSRESSTFGVRRSMFDVPGSATRRGAMKRSWWIFLFLFTVASARALEVQQVRWGFDGTVVPGRFNLLSVLIGNPSTKPFDGTVNLYKSRGMEHVGAPLG